VGPASRRGACYRIALNVATFCFSLLRLSPTWPISESLATSTAAALNAGSSVSWIHGTK
jgi:hypothetical protein